MYRNFFLSFFPFFLLSFFPRLTALYNAELDKTTQTVNFTVLIFFPAEKSLKALYTLEV